MSTPGSIKTYTSAPLNSKKTEEDTQAAKVQPQPATAIEAETTTATQPQTTTATATAPLYSPIYAATQPTNLPAQPGAAPSLPAPTAAVTEPTGNLMPTPTSTLPTSTSTQSPPPPQPGAVPQPPTASAQATVPPPPKAGEAITPSFPSTTQATTAPQPSTQFTSYAYHRSPHTVSDIPNSTSTPYSSVYQSPAGGGPSGPAGLPLHYNSGGGGGANSVFPEADEPSFFNTAKGWMQTAGSKLAEVEAEVWKRINNAHDDDK